MKAAVIEICWSSPVMRRKEKVLHNKWASNTPTSGVTVAAAQPNETVMRVGSSAPLSLQAAICLHFILLTFLCCSKRWRNTMEEHFLHLFPQVVVIFCCLCSVCVFKENSRERDLRFLCQLVGMRQQRNAVQKGSKVKKSERTLPYRGAMVSAWASWGERRRRTAGRRVFSSASSELGE